MKTQVKKDHYDFDKYVDQPRRNSYYHQINEVAKCKWKTVLLIWVWDWIVADCIKKIGKDVTTFDFDKALNPDIIWDVTKIDEIITKNYDIVVCCQVLEHIPFEKFESTIKKLSNIVNERLILSLPNRNIWIKIFVPILRHIKFPIRRFWEKDFNINKEWNCEHYWEIDATGMYRLEKIKDIIKKYFRINDIYIPFNNTYHVFFILKKDHT